jgi:P pilus assembly chaperone PapD
MKAIPSIPIRLASRALLLAGMAISAVATAQAAVVITGTATLNAGIYTYSYSVTNSGSTELTIIDIPIGESVTVSNESAPTGFTAISDGPPVNLVSFFPDSGFASGTFAPGSTVEFFTYQSTSAPFMVTFNAQDVNGDVFSGQTISAVPEPSGLMLIAASAVPLLAARRRRAQ